MLVWEMRRSLSRRFGRVRRVAEVEVVAEGVGVRTTALRVVCCQLKLWLWAWPLSLEALLFFSNATPKRSVWGWFYTSEAGVV